MKPDATVQRCRFAPLGIQTAFMADVPLPLMAAGAPYSCLRREIPNASPELLIRIEQGISPANSLGCTLRLEGSQSREPESAQASRRPARWPADPVR